MKYNILGLMPINPNQNEELTIRVCQAASFLVETLDSLVIDRRFVPKASGVNFSDRQDAMSRLRNQLIDEHLKSYHTHVFWMDGDVISYSSRHLICRLLEHPNSIVAPSSLLYNCKKQWYDIHGFIEDGQPVSSTYPYFKQEGVIKTLDCVGMCYMVPANVFRSGVRYYKVDGFTEHYSVCKDSKLSVICNTSVEAYHANLPDFGHDYNPYC